VQTITDTLAAKLTHHHPGTTVTAIQKTENGHFRLETAKTETVKTKTGAAAASPPAGVANALTSPSEYTHLALALPAYAVAPLLQPLFPQAAAALAAVHYPPMSAVYSAYDRAAVEHPLNGFGALHPKVEKTYAAGSIWTSSIFPGRVPAGQVLFTTFVGGAQYEAAAKETEAMQKEAVHAELSRFYGISGAPRWQGHYHWPRSIPQFDARIVPAHAAADALEKANIVAVANWRAGVGVPDCVRHARRTAETLAATLA
jgi:oxygen-dependent protoporphyrinogen oxidase